MSAVILFWGIGHLINAGYGLARGRVCYIYKPSRQFLPSVHWAEREQSAILFYLVIIANAGFGGFLVYFARTAFAGA